MTSRSAPPVLIVGAGPAGMAVAASLQREGVSFELIDRRGRLGGAYLRMFQGLSLLSPAKYTQLPGLPIQSAGEYVTVPEYSRYLADYATRSDLRVATGEVTSIRRMDRGFHVEFGHGREPESYAVVVVATGMFDSPQFPQIAGLPNNQQPSGTGPQVLHSRDWPGPSFSGRSVLVIGGGMSGVEIAEECAQAGIDVTVSTRRPVRVIPRRLLGRDIHHWVHLVSHHLPLWTLGSFCDRLPAFPAFDRGFREFLAAGKIAMRPEVVRFHQHTAEFADGSQADFDLIVLATGYRFATPFLPAEVARGSRGQPLLRNNQSRSWPDLFFVGFPCARIMPSEFLRGISLDAPIVARSIGTSLKASSHSV